MPTHKMETRVLFGRGRQQPAYINFEEDYSINNDKGYLVSTRNMNLFIWSLLAIKGTNPSFSDIKP